MTRYYNTYRMTPAERRARAQQIVQYREERSMLNRYLEEKERAEELMRQQEAARLSSERAERERNSANFLERGIATVGDLLANVGTGAVKGLEGIADLGLGLVGGIGGIFDDDFEDNVKDIIAKDWTGMYIGEPLQEALRYSYLKDGGIIENVASGVGQMLPSVAISIATGGAAAPALLTTMAGAAGNSTEQAFQEGADYWRGLGYGAMSGAVEGATEKLLGGATSKIFGAGIFDGVVRSVAGEVAEQGARRVIKDAAGEAFEEALAELVNPALKSIYKGRDAFKEYGEADYWKGVGESALVGGLSSVAFGGTVGRAMRTSGVYADVSSALEANDNIAKERRSLEKRDRLSPEAEASSIRAERQNLLNIEKALKRSNETQRQELFDRFKLDSSFESDGSIKESVIKRLEAMEKGDGRYRKEYYSVGMRGNEAMIEEDLKAISERTGVEAKVFDRELSETGKKNFTKTKKALAALNDSGGNNVSFVITEANEAYKGGLVDDKVIYIPADQLESDDWAGTLVHEFTHFEEGTDEYNEMFRFLQSDEILVDDGAGGKVMLWESARDAVLAKGYVSDVDQLDAVIGKANTEGVEALSKSEYAVYTEYTTELAAHETEMIMGNEGFIDHIIRTDEANGIVKRILMLDRALSSMKDKQARAQMKLIKQAERLYLRAAENAGNKRIVKMILAQDPELEEELTGINEEKMQVSEVQLSQKGNGYDGYSMSNNARSAYASGEMPISKWSKSEIIDSIAEINPDIDVSKLNLDTLRDKMLRKSSWHHTSMYYNATDFYSIKEEYISGLNQADVDELAKNQISKPKAERNKDLDEKVERVYQKALVLIEAGLVKTETGAINRILSSQDSGEDFRKAVELIKKRDSAKVDQWRKLPPEHYRQDHVKLYDNDIMSYINEVYASKKLSKNSTVFKKIAAHIDKPVVEKKVQMDLKDYGEYDKPITLHDVEVLRSIGRKSINQFSHEDIKKAQKWAYKFYNEFGEKSPFFRAWFGDWRSESISESQIVNFLYGESPKINYKERIVSNIDMKRKITVDSDVIGDSLHYAKANGDEKQIRKLLGKIDEILEKAIWLDTRISEKSSQNKKGSTQFMHYLYTPISINGAPFIAKLTVEEYDLTAKQRAYNLQRIEMSELSRAQYAQLISENKEKYAYSSDSLSVAQLFDFVKRFDETFKPNPVNERLLNEDGSPKILYHQTAEDFTEFDPRHEGAGTNDDETPFGIFMKPGDNDIGLKGKKQMALYAHIVNPIIVNDRAQLTYELKRMSNEYDDLLKQRTALSVEYKQKIEDAAKAWSQYAKEYRESHPNATRSEIYEDSTFRKLFDAEDVLAEEWIKKANELSVRCKEVITKTLKDNEYDGVILKKDEGSGGRTVETYIALDPEQVKSATDNIGTFDKNSKDIRFNLKEMHESVDNHRNKYYNYYIESGESIQKVPFELPRDFARSLANKTSDLSEGKTKIIYVCGYIFAADGYMHGHILAPYNEKTKKLLEVARSEKVTINEDSEVASLWVRSVEDARRRSGSDSDIFRRGRSGLDDRLSGTQSRRDVSGNNERVRKTFETKEEIDEIVSKLRAMYGLDSVSEKDIRFNLKEKNPFEDTGDFFADENDGGPVYKVSDGKVRKVIADNTRMKVYTRAESEQIVNQIVSENLSFGELYGSLQGKSRREAIDLLWNGLNSADVGEQGKVALDVAEYIINNAAVESIYDGAGLEVYTDTVALLKPYLHKMNLSSIKGDISHHYGKDSSPYLLWGKRRGEVGLSPEQVAAELSEAGFKIDAENPADIFIQINDAYRDASAHLKKEAKAALNTGLTADERKKLKQDIARDVLMAFEKGGSPSKFAGIVDRYIKEAKVWRDKYYAEKEKNEAISHTLYKLKQIRDLKTDAFLNASEYKPHLFKGSIESLSKIEVRGKLNKSSTRKIVAGLAEWYTRDNPMLEGNNLFDEEIEGMLYVISHGKGQLSTDEVVMLGDMIDYFSHFVENYNKVYRAGKYIDAKPEAERYINLMRDNERVKVGWFGKVTGSSYLKTFGDPMTVMRRMDLYERGFYTEMMEQLREGAIGASVMEMKIREPLEAFYEKHKKFLQTIRERKIKYEEFEMTASQAMLYYMTLNRKQALAGLAKSGFAYIDENNKTVRVPGFLKTERMDDATRESAFQFDNIEPAAKVEQAKFYDQFTDAEKQFISIAEKIFNEDCKNAKREVDMKRKGFSNALEDYYVPIRRGNIAKSVDAGTFFDEMNRASNASFNKDTVRGAKNELFIESLDNVLDRHIRGVSQYANLALVIDAYDTIFNLAINNDPNKPETVKTVSANVWRDGAEYFKNVISDIQGIPVESRREGYQLIKQLRSSYAKYQLGANPKVWVTQLSSFAAAGSILDIDCISRGLGINAKDVDEYCSLAKLRNSENTVAMAQGLFDEHSKPGKVLEATGKFGDVLMTPIGWVDRFVVTKLFGACQAQIEKNGGAKIGTKANKQTAGELLQKVILETQQNATSTDRSAAMRSGNELMKTITMFTADSMKVMGRVIDSVGEVSVLKARLKTATVEERTKLETRLKAAEKQARRSIASLVSSAAFMAVVAQLFRTLYNKDDDDENIAANMAVDAAGNLIGGLPIFKDIASFFMDGYGLDNYAYSALNDLLESAGDIFDIVGAVASGELEGRELASTLRKMAYASGQILGLPTRNAYNAIYGLIKRVSPSTAYGVDDMFYNQSYRADLTRAIEKGDDDMIAMIAGIMLDENVGGIEDSKSRQELDRLISAGFDVIPRATASSITYDGEEYVLDASDKKDFEKIYTVANEVLADLVKMSKYQSASDDVKASAISYIYKVYWDLAVQEIVGEDLETKTVLFAEAIDIEKLALIVATASMLKADTDKSGKAVSGSRKKKIQEYVNSLELKAVEKYMIMGYLGYKNVKGEAQVKSYINKLRLTKSEREKLIEYSGY